MKKLFLFLVFAPAIVSGDTPAKVSDGKVEYAVAKVNGKLAWTQKEKDMLIASFSPGLFATSTVVMEDFSPNAFEMSLSTTFAFQSNSAFESVKKMTNEELCEAKKELDRENRTKNFRKDRK